MGRKPKYPSGLLSTLKRERDYRACQRATAHPRELYNRLERAKEIYGQALSDWVRAMASVVEEFKRDETVTEWLTNGDCGIGLDYAEIAALKMMGRDPDEAVEAIWYMLCNPFLGVALNMLPGPRGSLAQIVDAVHETLVPGSLQVGDEPREG